MKKIATHNSATGERGAGLLSWLVRPFSRCQSKTLTQQHAAGCRLFDIRVRRHSDGELYCYHGLWRSRRTMLSLLAVLDILAKWDTENKTYIFLTYEGEDSPKARRIVTEARVAIFHALPHLHVVRLASKHPYGTVFWRAARCPKVVEDYSGISFKNRRWLFPVPRFWWKRRPKPIYTQTTFTMVDFL